MTLLWWEWLTLLSGVMILIGGTFYHCSHFYDKEDKNLASYSDRDEDRA